MSAADAAWLVVGVAKLIFDKLKPSDRADACARVRRELESLAFVEGDADAELERRARR